VLLHLAGVAPAERLAVRGSRGEAVSAPLSARGRRGRWRPGATPPAGAPSTTAPPSRRRSR